MPAMFMSTDTVPWYLSPARLPPVFGLLGVLAGGLITFASSYFLERRRDQKNEQKETRERARELKRASRLLHADFVEVEQAIETTLKMKQWWPDNYRLEASCWHECRSSLASSLSREQWDDITTAVAAMGGLQGARDIDVGRKRYDLTGANTIPFVEGILVRVTAGRKAIENMTVD